MIRTIASPACCLVLLTLLPCRGLLADQLSLEDQQRLTDAWKKVKSEETPPFFRVRVWTLIRGGKGIVPMPAAQFQQLVHDSKLMLGEEARKQFALMVSPDAVRHRDRWQLHTLTSFGKTTRVESPGFVRIVDGIDDIASDRSIRQINITRAGSSPLTYLKLADLRHVPPPGIASNGTIRKRTNEHLVLDLFSKQQKKLFTYAIDPATSQASEWTSKDPNGKTVRFGSQSASIPLDVDMFLPRLSVSATFLDDKLFFLKVLLIDEVTIPFVPDDLYQLGTVGGLAGDLIIDERAGPNSLAEYFARKAYTDVRAVRSETKQFEQERLKQRREGPSPQGNERQAPDEALRGK